MTRVVAIFAYWLGFDALFYWLNRKSKRIITFHNVFPDEMFREGVANGVSNRLSDFKKIVEMCKRRFPIDTDMFNARSLTITFDDGYHNQYEYAFKTLREMGVEAYVFVSADTKNGALTIDKLLHWVSEAPIEYIKGGDRLRMWCDEIWPKFLKDSKAKGEAVLCELDTIYPYEKVLASLSEDYKRERLIGISEDELNEMRVSGWKIGWHTRSHYPLAKLSESQVREELESPKEFRSICLSYPYGNPCEVGDDAIRIAREFEYPCAVANTNESEHGQYFLPRIALSADKYLLHFELSGCKYFIKHFRLLPHYQIMR